MLPTGERSKIEIAVVALGALIARLSRLGAQDLWLDEAFSWHFVTTRPLAEVLITLPQTDPHPPLYYALLYLWTELTGTSEFALRFPSVIFGVVAVVLTYLLTRRMFDHQVGVLSAALVAVAPFQIRYSQEVRMYSLFVLLTVASMYFFISTIQRGSKNDMAGYTISTVLLGYTHVYAFFIIAVQVCFLVYQSVTQRDAAGQPVSIKRWLLLQSAVFVALSPWILELAGRALFETETTILWLPRPGPLSILAVPVFWLTGFGFHPVVIVLLPLSTILILLRAINPNKVAESLSWTTLRQSLSGSDAGTETGSHEYELLLFLWIGVPVTLGIVLSYLLQPIWHVRYTASAAVGFYILIARGLTTLKPAHIRAVLIVVLFVGFLFPLVGHYSSASTQAWGDTTASIEGNATEADLIIISDSHMQVPFNYYWDRPDVTIKTVSQDASPDSTGNLSDGDHVRETYERVPANAVDDVAVGYDTVWLVLANTEESHDRRLLDSLERVATRSDRTRYPGIVVYRFES